MKWVNVIKITVIIIGIAYTHPGFAQTAIEGSSRFYAENVKQVDGVIKVISAFCSDIKPVQVSKTNIKFDQKYILNVNKLFNSVTSDKTFAQDAKKYDLVQTSSLNAGLIGFREYKFYPPKGYLAISILLSVIEDSIFYKKIIVENPIKRACAGSNQTIPFFDFLYLKNYILPLIDFPLKSCTSCDNLIVDTLSRPVLQDMANKYPAYKFLPAASTDVVRSLILQHTYLQSGTYNNKIAPDGFVQLVKLKEYEIIKSLLYSPNQLVAINAYETLVYLKSKSELTTNSQDDAKMQEILNSDVSIPVYCGRDCKPTNFTYNTLKVKNEDIIDKYQSGLEQ